MISGLDFGIILAYFLALVLITFLKKSSDTSELSFLLAGRSLTLPAFVATLVSTWYGGILGVGEFGYQHGISQWLVFGVPYYIFAIAFAFLLVNKIRASTYLSLPEAITKNYGPFSGKIASSLIFLLTNPAPYVVMLALLFRFLLNDDSSYVWYAIGVTLFSTMYVWFGGFSAVVQTDKLQFILMYAGFAVVVFVGLDKVGGISALWNSLPESHTSPTGGQPLTYVFVWFFIALWTFIDPGFHQRVSAAKTPKIARWGIFISVLCWVLFDMLTLTTSLIGFTLIKDVANPVLIYPKLGVLILPSGIRGLFFLGLLATIMSTLDSFLFISGQTIGRDGFFQKMTAVKSTRIGMAISAVIAIVLSILFPSVIDLWYGLGTAIIPGLLLTVLGAYLPFFKIDSKTNGFLMIFGTSVSLFWMILGEKVNPFLGIEPFYPGILSAILIWTYAKINQRKELKLS